MAHVTFAPDRPPPDRPPLDRSLEEQGLAASALGKPIKIRLQPDLYDHQGAKYVSWAGLTWIVDVADVEEGRRLREGLTDFFKLFGMNEAVQQGLLKVLREAINA